MSRSMRQKLMAIVLSVGLITGIGIVSTASASAAPKPVPKPAPVLNAPSLPSLSTLSVTTLTAYNFAEQAYAITPTAKAAQAKADLAAGATSKKMCKNISKVLSVSGGIGAAAFALGAVTSGAPPVAAAAGVVSTVASSLAVASYLSSFLVGC